jgi:transposase
MRILVAVEPADFRKGIDGMVQLCRSQLSAEAFSGTLFVFRNRRRTAIKALVYDGRGFWLCHKRLSTGRFQWWPSDATSSVQLEPHQFALLAAAGNLYDARAPTPWRPVTPQNLPI